MTHRHHQNIDSQVELAACGKELVCVTDADWLSDWVRLQIRSDQGMDRQTRIYLFEALSTAMQGTGRGWVGQCWSKAGGLVAKEGPMRGRDSLTDTRTSVGPTQAG